MTPALLAASLEGIATIAQAVQQAQAGQLTPDQLAAVWAQQATRCAQANAAWAAAGGAAAAAATKTGP